MNVLVVDDRELAVEDLLDELKKIDSEGVHIGVTSVKEAIKTIEEMALDIAFLDIEMPEMTGIELAKLLKDKRPELNIIFVTGHSEYALQAHQLYVSGFLVKPAAAEDIQIALEHLRFPIKTENNNRIRFHTFGNFAVYVDEKPLKFKRGKTLELLAYLVDRQGAEVTMGELIGVLWEDAINSDTQKGYLRHLIADLQSTFAEVGIPESFIIRGRNTIHIDAGRCNCDYYDFLKGLPAAINAYHGEYMTQFSWAEMTLAGIEK